MTGCFGGQTGAPSGCAPPSAESELAPFEGVYVSPVVFSLPPAECPVSPDGLLRIEVFGDLGDPKARAPLAVDCDHLAQIPVLVRQSIDDGEPTTEPGWLQPNGLVVLVTGGGAPDSGAPERSLYLNPDLGKVSLSWENLSTVEGCCVEALGNACP